MNAGRSVELPIAVGNLAHPERARSSIPRRLTVEDHARVRLMIVDGNADVRRVIRQIVGDLAADVYECPTPVDAFSTYARIRPDVVVMDLSIPPCDGIWATRQIIGLYPQAVIVLIAPYPDAMFRVTAVRAGARGFVLKENLFDLRQWLAAWTPEPLKGERT